MKTQGEERDESARRAAPPAPEARQKVGVRGPMTPRVAQRLQSAAGNRAVAGLLAQRRTIAQAPAASVTKTQHANGQVEIPAAQAGAAATLAEPVQRLATDAGPVHRAGPQSDPKFAALRADVGRRQQTMAAHPPPSTEASRAQCAAKPPQDDREAQGKAANAEKMNAAKPGEFDKAAFLRAVNEAIAAQAPKNLDEADTFGESGKAAAVKGQVQGEVGAGKKQAAGQIESATKAPPDTSVAKEKQVTPLAADRPPATPGTPDPTRAVPDKAPAAATDFSAGPAQVDQQLAEAQVTEDQLAKSNEPEFTGALRDKATGEEHATTAPGQVRATEAQTVTAAKAQAGQQGAAAMAAMAGARNRSGQAVGSGKQEAKTADEQKRAQVTSRLQRVFDATKKDVEDILSGLDKKVDDTFTKGEKAARDAFTAEHKRRMDEYKDKRYSGLLGKGRWIKDKFAGLPEEANQIFVAARKGYVDRMQQVISAVADVIGADLTRAKQRIATGRTELQAEVKKLPADLQAIGKEAAGEFAGRFDELTESVNSKGTELVQTLATRYKEALTSIDDEIAAEKEKNKGLIAKAVDAVAGVIRTIMQLKDMLLGVLAKAAQAVMAIIKDPIGFLGNLVSAVGAGLKAFLGNIGQHLKKGLIGWLTGAMAGAGLELPDKFDLRGIVLMIGSLLGLTWANIRGLIIRRGVPEPAMTAVEGSVPLVQKVRSEGVGGLWEEIKEKVGDLKENLFGKISEYLIPTILTAGITWIVSLLNPASAFIRACKMIIDFVTFIVTQGAQIIEFVTSVLDAVIAIAGGGAGGVPQLIEQALVRSIPVLIGALAAILGVGGIAQKVKSFFQALSKPVMKAVDWVVGKIAAMGRKIWAKLRGKDRKGRADGDGRGTDVRSVARQAAEQGWGAAARVCGRQVVRGGELEAALRKAEGTRNGVTVRLDIVEAGTSWQVRAQASKGGKRATAEQGKGWIATGEGGRWYAAEDLTAFNKSLVDEAFAELKRDAGTPEDVRAGYRQKVAAGQQVAHRQQGRLDGRMKGLRFTVDMEPYAKVEQDKQIATTIDVTPNETKDKQQVPVNGEEPFDFEIGPAKGPVELVDLSVADHLDDLEQPMKGGEDGTGYVVNMAAMPSEAEGKPDMAARYADQAWVGASKENSTMARTAVVAGINTFRSVDPAKEQEGAGKVNAAVGKVKSKAGLRSAIFGFQWTPSWKKKTGGAVPLSTVREAFSKLSGDKQEKVRTENETNWRDGKKLPYGIFREAILGSSYTRRAVDLLKKVNKQVHVVSQDADGGVATASGKGVLAVYDEVLKGFERHPLLTIGGYTFEGFDWTQYGKPRTQQLTEMNNRVDRAIRVAIAEVYAKMLYPTEPNMLIKAHDREFLDGIFDHPKVKEEIAKRRGGLYGVGATEGRQLKNNLAKEYGDDFSMEYAPEASTTTSPLPGDRTRGLTVHEEDVPRVARGQVDFIPANAHTLHPMYAAIVQSQSYTSARTLAREFSLAYPALANELRVRLEQRIFVQVEDIAKLLADNPELRRDSPEVQACLARRDQAIKDLLESDFSADVIAKTAIERAIKITAGIVAAMTGDDLKVVWRELNTTLAAIMHEADGKGGT